MNVPDDHSNYFLSSENGSYTYGDLQKFTSFFSSYLKKHEIDRSHPIGMAAESCDQYIFLIAACWNLKFPFVCFNPDTKKTILKKQIKELNPSLIFTDRPQQINTFFSKTEAIHSLSLQSILAGGLSVERFVQCNKENQEQIFGFFFTSGTTTEPKIVPLKRRQMLTAARASEKNLNITSNEYWLLCMPVHHVGGISIILRSLIYKSALYRLNYFDSNGVGQLLAENKNIAAASLVPTMLKRLLDDNSFVTHSKFKAILLGGGPISPVLLKKCLNRNIPVISSYGMSETCAQICANRIKNSNTNLKSVGTIFEPNSIEIRNPDGKNLPQNSSGAIWLKGPQVFDGYLNQSKENSFDTNGWFNTGDFGRLDDRGRLTIEARRTDRIITGGENVSPFDVEEVIRQIEGIREAAVTGLPDDEWGQIVAAVIVTEPNYQLSAGKIKESLKNSLESYKIPKKIFFAKKLPRTNNGKVKRKELEAFF